MKPLITPQAAAALIGEAMPVAPIHSCPLEVCMGRILREAIQADRPFPPFDRSMMDGYAARIEDLALSDRLTITGSAWAGAPQLTLEQTKGSTLEIMTGAVVPGNANCVIPYEETTLENDGSVRVLNTNAHKRGDCIHRMGSDFPTSGTLVTAGSVLRSHEMALAATCGYTSLNVSQLPRIAILSTGDELVPVDKTPERHQIRQSNDVAIATTLTRFGTPAGERVHLPDEKDATRAKLTEVLQENEVIIISGGISMGKKDFIPETLEELGLHCHFHGVSQKPGKPMGFWKGTKSTVFTLPGNPLSALTCLHAYVLPALSQILQLAEMPFPSTVHLSKSVKGRDDLTVFLPVKIEAGSIAIPCPAKNSGDLVTVSHSHGYIELPPSTEPYNAGDAFGFTPWL